MKDYGKIDYYNMEFKLINEDKFNLVSNLLKDAAVWLRSKNINYWQNWHNPTENHKNWILNGLKNNQFYLIYDNNTQIGMFRLQYNDETFWGKKNDKAGYIHSFTINRKMSGKGLGYKVLNEIEIFLKQNGYNYLRLDCGIKIKGLCEYYKNYGFNEAGSVTIHGEKLLLLEKNL